MQSKDQSLIHDRTPCLLQQTCNRAKFTARSALFHTNSESGFPTMIKLANEQKAPYFFKWGAFLSKARKVFWADAIRCNRIHNHCRPSQAARAGQTRPLIKKNRKPMTAIFFSLFLIRQTLQPRMTLKQ